MKWQAYCKECQKDLTDGGWNNGSMVEAQAKLHIKGHEDHHVLVGYETEKKGGDDD